MTEEADLASHALDLTQYHARYRVGDVTVFLTWFGKQSRPAMVLTPTMKHGDARMVPCVVPLASIWAWDEHTGDGAHCARTSKQFAALLGLSPSVQSIVKVTSIIRDFIGDLIRMPPKPAEKIVVADAFVTNRNTGKTTEREIVANAAS